MTEHEKDMVLYCRPSGEYEWCFYPCHGKLDPQSLALQYGSGRFEWHWLTAPCPPRRLRTPTAQEFALFESEFQRKTNSLTWRVCDEHGAMLVPNPERYFCLTCKRVAAKCHCQSTNSHDGANWLVLMPGTDRPSQTLCKRWGLSIDPPPTVAMEARPLPGTIPLDALKGIAASSLRGSDPGFVYVAVAPCRGTALKIGKAKTPLKRLKQHRTVLPDVAFIRLWESPDARGTERMLHNRFKTHRVGGEWFSINIEDVDRVMEEQAARKVQTA